MVDRFGVRRAFCAVLGLLLGVAFALTADLSAVASQDERLADTAPGGLV